ncbi:winged helix-turn-helix domain-containing protein [Chloroflexota bacterium]
MAIPDYQTIMLPLLEFSAYQKEHSLRDAIEALAIKFDLSKEERLKLTPGGGIDFGLL